MTRIAVALFPPGGQIQTLTGPPIPLPHLITLTGHVQQKYLLICGLTIICFLSCRIVSISIPWYFKIIHESKPTQILNNISFIVRNSLPSSHFHAAWFVSSTCLVLFSEDKSVQTFFAAIFQFFQNAEVKDLYLGKILVIIVQQLTKEFQTFIHIQLCWFP